jgi:hypothetical protein
MSTKAGWRGGVLSLYDSVTYETVAKCAPVQFYDDFLTPSLVIPALGALESGVAWCKKITGAAPPTVASVANTANGVILCHGTADVQKQDAGLYFGDQLVFNATTGLVFETRLKLAVVPTLHAEAVWGIIGAWADGPDAIVYSAFFTADGSAEIFCEKDDDVTNQSVTSGITVLNTAWHIYKIDFTDVADVRFYIDGAQVASGTTFPWAATLGNSAVQPYLGIYKVGDDAGLADIQIDYVRLYQDRS